MKVDTININKFTIDGLLEMEWKGLTADNSAARFFHEVDWYAAYLNNLVCDSNAQGLIKAYEDDVLIGIIPYLKKVRKIIGPIDQTTICTPQHAHLPLTDCILKPGVTNNLFERLVRTMRSNRDIEWDILLFSGVIDESEAKSNSKKVPLSVCKHAERYSDYLTCDGDNTHIDKLSVKFKRNIRRLGKRASSIGPISFEYITDRDQLDDAYSTFLDIEASGWKGVAGTNSAIKLDPTISQFYREVVHRFGMSGRCQINLMKIGDNYVAGQLCLKSNQILHILKIGYDQDYSNVAPGSLLLYDLLERCTEDPSLRIVSLVTGPEWSKRWHPSTLNVYNVYYFNRTLIGYMSYLAMKSKDAVKALIRSLKDAGTDAANHSSRNINERNDE